jgi:hypothetical protein
VRAGYPELVIGGVLIAPFVTYAVVAALVVVLLRPLLRIAGFERALVNPPLVLLGLYVIALAALLASL